MNKCKCGVLVGRQEVCTRCSSPVCPSCIDGGGECKKCQRNGAVPQRMKAMRSKVYRATHKTVARAEVTA